MRRLLSLILVLATATAVAACTPKPITGPAGASSPSMGEPAQATPPQTVGHERVVQVALPAGFDPPQIEFADAENGFAMFNRCAPDSCEARLFSTTDGGVSWQARVHPRPMAKNHQLYLGRGRTVGLLAEPHAWYVSRDFGATWGGRPYTVDGDPPTEYAEAPDGQFYLACSYQSGSKCVIRDATAGPQWQWALPAGFEQGPSLTNGKDGRVWLATVQAGAPVISVSQIGTRAFQRLAVPPQPGRKVWAAWSRSRTGPTRWHPSATVCSSSSVRTSPAT
jgi:hypothetical protein